VDCASSAAAKFGVNHLSLSLAAELTTYVKTEMKMRGFVSRSFHELRNDMSSGSRELLLGFGWLLCRGEIMDKFMEKCCSSLDSIPTPVVVSDQTSSMAPSTFNSQNIIIMAPMFSNDPNFKIRYEMLSAHEVNNCY